MLTYKYKGGIVEDWEKLEQMLDDANSHAKSINDRFESVKDANVCDADLATQFVSQIELEREAEGEIFANKPKEMQIKKTQEDCKKAQKDAQSKGYNVTSKNSSGGQR